MKILQIQNNYLLILTTKQLWSGKQTNFLLRECNLGKNLINDLDLLYHHDSSFESKVLIFIIVNCISLNYYYYIFFIHKLWHGKCIFIILIYFSSLHTNEMQIFSYYLYMRTDDVGTFDLVLFYMMRFFIYFIYINFFYYKCVLVLYFLNHCIYIFDVCILCTSTEAILHDFTWCFI